jgi:hypothetical protein
VERQRCSLSFEAQELSADVDEISNLCAKSPRAFPSWWRRGVPFFAEQSGPFLLTVYPQDIRRAIDYGLDHGQDKKFTAAKPGEIMGYFAHGRHNGESFDRVQAIQAAIDDYAELETGNREYFWDRPVGIGRCDIAHRQPDCRKNTFQ